MSNGLKHTWVERNRAIKKHEVAPNGVPYLWDLVSPDGASFQLLRGAHHTDADIEAAKRHLKNERDVVGQIRVSEEGPGTHIVANGWPTDSSIDGLIKILETHEIRPDWPNFEPSAIHHEGFETVRFSGNFVTQSHTFIIRTNDPDVIKQLTQAIQSSPRYKENQELAAARALEVQAENEDRATPASAP
jgi:hypothetical protein